MNITPAPATPVGEPTDADRARARDRLSAIHGRTVSGGHAVDTLAAEYAQCRADGYRAAQLAAVPAPRDAWRDTVIRGGLRR